jgi:hypothetical protein
MTESRRPVHLAVLVGTATAAYAVSLAGVTALQSETDQARIADRAPTAHLADQLGDGHDRLEATVQRAADAYARAAERYDALTRSLDATEADLGTYAERVAAVGGAARDLPARVSLPTVRQTVTRTVAKPRVSASTGASGG